ncbi:MAG: DUF4129 domain-containing protein [Candidatus Bipolaricaulaceae bacterium]
MTRAKLLAAGAMIILALGVLAAGLWDAEFQGGRPLAQAFALPAAADAQRISESTVALLLRILHVALLASFALCLAVFILVPRVRRQLLRALAVGAVLTVAAVLLINALFRPAEQWQASPQGGLPAGGGVATPGEEGTPPPQAPDWAVYAAAACVGVGLAWWGRRRLAGRRPRRREEGELAQVAAEAAAALRGGAAVADVVLRCWIRMVEVVAPQARVDHLPALTPQELADLLHARGFRHQAIDELTRLFEEVRYGHKPSESRRDRAIAALSTIERAYA